ncbi:hypothetical protein [Azospirillum argentinense]|uniref:hypothetical protein n=1 Tax=Azospirillum argentinense TaxID=2970906 RepID=UPI0032DFD0FB
MTDLPDPSLAPGCHGQALTFDTDAPECQGCPFQAGCHAASAANLQAFQVERTIIQPGEAPRLLRQRAARKTAAPAAPAPAATLTPSLPVKVRELVARVNASGLQVGASLRAGVNPFDKPAWLRVASHLLLRVETGFDRKTLSLALQKTLAWEKATADSYAGQAFHLFPALGAAREVNGRLIIARD